MGIFSIFKKTSTAYFPGCIAYYKDKEEFEIYKRIFGKLGIDFKIIDKKVCCGLPAYEAGYDYEARKLVRRNFEIFKEEKINNIITTCPVCYKMFGTEYTKFLPDWNIEVINIWKIILDKLKQSSFIINNKAGSLSEDNDEKAGSLSEDNEEIGFQDSCYLGRYMGIYEEPREILKLIGYRIIELKDNRENSICCGSCGGLPKTFPALADKAAKERLLQAKRTGIKKLVVCSLEEYELLKNNSADTGINIVLFSEILGNALGIKRKVEGIENEQKRNDLL